MYICKYILSVKLILYGIKTTLNSQNNWQANFCPMQMEGLTFVYHLH